MRFLCQLGLAILGLILVLIVVLVMTVILRGVSEHDYVCRLAQEVLVVCSLN